MSVLKEGHHASPSHQVQGRLRHRGLLSAMQRDLFKVSRHSFGHPVIGSCLHIKHKSVLHHAGTQHRMYRDETACWME